MIDLLAAANYQRAKVAGAKGVSKPKPVPRPGVEPEGRSQYGKGSGMSIAEMRRVLDEWHHKEVADGS